MNLGMLSEANLVLVTIWRPFDNEALATVSVVIWDNCLSISKVTVKTWVINKNAQPK